MKIDSISVACADYPLLSPIIAQGIIINIKNDMRIIPVSEQRTADGRKMAGRTPHPTSPTRRQLNNWNSVTRHHRKLFGRPASLHVGVKRGWKRARLLETCKSGPKWRCCGGAPVPVPVRAQVWALIGRWLIVAD